MNVGSSHATTLQLHRASPMAKHLARALFQSLRGFNTRIEQALRLDPDTFEELPMEVQSAFYTISEEIFRWSPEK